MRGTVGDDVRLLVLGAAAVMVCAALAFRGWALSRGWFYFDDYVLLSEAEGRDLDLDYLLMPYDIYFMPGARALSWVVAQVDGLGWSVAAVLVVLMHALAGAAAVWMLVTAFGARWGILAPLALYLSTAVTIQTTLWWASAINQLPLHTTFFVSVAAWLLYLRTGRVRWLLLTAAAVAVGLLFYVKALLVFPVLAFLAVGYFTSGSVATRARTTLARWWPAAVVGGLLLVAYEWYTLTQIERPLTSADTSLAGEVAETMIGTAFASGVVGGPWSWSDATAPTVGASPPLWTQHVAWVVIVLVMAYIAARRSGTGRAWLLLWGYVLVDWVLLVTSRAPVVGDIAGLQYRYLADAAPVVALCLGLACLELRGAESPSRPRERPLVLVKVPALAVVACVATVVVMGVLSSISYTRGWEEGNASASFTRNLASDLDGQGSVDLVDGFVPGDAAISFDSELNRISTLTGLLGVDARFPEATPKLAVVDDDGAVLQALIEPSTTSEPGPVAGCGWRIKERGGVVPLAAPVPGTEDWIRLGYLSSASSPVTVTLGDTEVASVVEPGLNSLYVRSSGPFDEVRIDGLSTGTQLCVDVVEVGLPVPGAPLP